MNILLSHRLQ